MSALPDWSAKEEIQYFTDLAEAKEWHYARIRPMIVAVMTGRIPCCPGLLRGTIYPMDASDFWEAITTDLDPKDFAKLMVGYMDRDAHTEAAVWAQETLDAYCGEMAEFMAKEEVMYE